ncbi:hypothetical protein FB451DRAFT_1249075 [Mycena latifolia]|nr:hypothetical protein FB451DRAFT_1249075 [Mycena latifolia]
MSSFTPMLGTNYAPKDEEIAEIQALLVEPTHQLERLDAEMATMQMALDKLAEERDRLATYVAEHKALISPVRRLPLDIIQEIFIACMPTHRNCVMTAREAPVLLGRICSAWRNISLSTPRLWASLHVVEPSPPFNVNSSVDALFETKWAQRLETAKAWLERSGRCPLSISFEGGLDYTNNMTPSPPIGHQHTALFLAALIPFAPRWQHISVTVTTPALETLAPLTRTDVPILQSIALSQHQDHSFHQINWTHFGILGADRVSSFSMFGTNFHVQELPLRWDLLTSLSLLGPTRVVMFGGPNPSITSETALQTIARCPGLRSCSLRLVDELATDTPVQHHIVEHPFIKSFELCCVGTATGDTFSHLLGNLSLPQLQSFTLRIYSPMVEYIYVPEAISRLGQFLASSTHLESLDIDTATFPKPSLVQILCDLPPTLQRLRMNDVMQHPHGGWGWDSTVSSGLDDDVMDILPTAPYSHALQEIDIQYSNTISDAALLRFITSMMATQPRPKLRWVHVEFSRAIQFDILPEIQQEIESGLEVSITHPPPIPLYFSPWQGLPDYIQISAEP